ncbi:hypothetical protein SHKM778_26220 [Streptomyces sp. KM77-8]|uniref:Uncharacterized protein n=1 Tax=Streptomyces haneummycinicus TaxID=3074435 RepID=A0AAT9HFQ4_9ACTN
MARLPAALRPVRPRLPDDVDGRADDGWVLRAELAAWSPDWWQERIGEWLQRLRDRDGRLRRPFIVVLRGPSPLLEDQGPGVLTQVRDDLENRLGTPVTALSRHRPGKRYRNDGTAHPDDDVHPADANALSDLRRRDPGRYGRALECLAADERLPGHRASLSAAAEYDDDIRAWIGALGAGRPVPRPGDLPLDIGSERADTIALALLKQVAKLSDGDLLAWDDPCCPRPSAAWYAGSARAGPTRGPTRPHWRPGWPPTRTAPRPRPAPDSTSRPGRSSACCPPARHRGRCCGPSAPTTRPWAGCSCCHHWNATPSG